MRTKRTKSISLSQEAIDKAEAKVKKEGYASFSHYVNQLILKDGK